MADEKWRQNAATGEWQQLAEDGYWYASEAGPPPTNAQPNASTYEPAPPADARGDSGPPLPPRMPPPTGAVPLYIAPPKSSHKNLWIILAVVAAVVVGVVVFVIVKNTGTNGLPPGTSLSSFESSTLHEIRSSATSGFDEPSAASVSCVMPHTWATGNTYKCFAFDSKGNEVGQVVGTVLASSGGNWNADNQWTSSG